MAYLKKGYKAKILAGMPVLTTSTKTCVCCGMPAEHFPYSDDDCHCRYCLFCPVHNELWLKWSITKGSYVEFLAKHSKPPLDKDGYIIDGVF